MHEGEGFKSYGRRFILPSISVIAPAKLHLRDGPGAQPEITSALSEGGLAQKPTILLISYGSLTEPMETGKCIPPKFGGCHL